MLGINQTFCRKIWVHTSEIQIDSSTRSSKDLMWWGRRRWMKGQAQEWKPTKEYPNITKIAFYEGPYAEMFPEFRKSLQTDPAKVALPRMSQCKRSRIRRNIHFCGRYYDTKRWDWETRKGGIELATSETCKWKPSKTDCSEGNKKFTNTVEGKWGYSAHWKCIMNWVMTMNEKFKVHLR